ncbi:MAG: 2-hydroxyacyl-CoA dehydratase family protein [Proteobacteria bacterium]|nr:2-hydroxyacyl-CoA dehydratase family protein [Pseudomonadota bacterium]
MNEIFIQAANRVNNPAIEEWKAQGKKVIGLVCSHVPEEVITAAGMFSYRLRGIETDSTSIGDTYFGPFICSCPKAILENAGRGRYNFLDGAIMVQACDSMRRLDECWRKAGEDYANIVPSFFHYMGVPHKVTDYAIAWFAQEIEKFALALTEHFGAPSITPDSLAAAISLHNESRRLLMDLEALRNAGDPPLSGEEAMTIILAGTAMPKSVYNPMLAETIRQLSGKSAGHAGKKRILLAGSVVDDLGMFRAIEAEGAIVVADTVCFGSRAYDGLVAEDDPSYTTLARRYLNEQFCPRMFGYYEKRLEVLKQKIETAKIDGVILQNIRFCDLHGSENGLFERDLEALGIPCIRVEREYGPLGDEGRVRMRVSAFLERLS